MNMIKFKAGDVIAKNGKVLTVAAVCHHRDGGYDYQCLSKTDIVYLKPEDEYSWIKIDSHEQNRNNAT